jgi:hypothetical protein
MKLPVALALCFSLAAFLDPLEAKIKLGDLFGDNMVLQRDTVAPVWGTSDPGEAVKLTFGDQTVREGGRQRRMAGEFQRPQARSSARPHGFRSERHDYVAQRGGG